MGLPSRGWLAAALLAALAAARPSGAQGVVSAALQGTVARADRTPVGRAQIDVTNVATGQRWRAGSRADGRYFIENLPIGGPYTVEVHVLGLRPGTLDQVRLALGQRYTADFTLEPVTTVLSPVRINARIDARVDPRLDAARTGPAQTIPDSLVRNLPNVDRDVLSLAVLSPQVMPNPIGAYSPGVVIAGQNPIYNAYQIDGGVNGDQPNGGPPLSGARMISIEAVKEFQVLAAPFDVRFGGFSGGLINTVTRSGENKRHGSLFGYAQQRALTGRDINDDKPPDFTDWEYGGSLSGPIRRDKLHFFISADLRRLTFPDNGPFITDTVGGAELRRIGIDYASVARFQRLLRGYGLDPGSLGRLSGSAPAQDWFVKLTLALGASGHLELSHHMSGDQPIEGIPREYGSYYLTSTAFGQSRWENASRLIWTTLVRGHASNELIVSRVLSANHCALPGGGQPVVTVTVDGTSQLWSGGGCDFRGSTTTWELGDNVTLGVGSHVMTLGAHVESIRFSDTFLANRAGIWTFDSLDSLERGQASDYERSLPGPLRPSNALEFPTAQVGAYVQDRWSLGPKLTMTLGVRLDVPMFTKRAATNPVLESLTGYDTGRLPGDHPLVSPRIGMSYDVAGDGSTFVRGGIGLFSARLPGRYVRNGYTDSGGDVLTVSCAGADTPRFTPLQQPVTCGSGPEAIPQVSVFDPGLRLPQTVRLSLGADKRLSWGVVATVDLLYSRGLHTLYFSDLNLDPPIAVASGEGNRPLYGTPGADATFVTIRPLAAVPALAGLGPITHITNRDAGRDVSASLRLDKSFEHGRSFSASYTFSRTTDLQSAFNYRAHLNIENVPLDGTIDRRNVRSSYFEVPHKLVVTGSTNLPFTMRLSLLYLGVSQLPYTFVIEGDANGDQIGSSDLLDDAVYVPRDATPNGDIELVEPDENGRPVAASPSTYRLLQRFIDQHACLRSQRGALMRRNSCRNGWHGALTGRLTKLLPSAHGQSLSLVADVFNLPNLLVHKWGRYNYFSGYQGFPSEVRLLRLAGWDIPRDRGRYRLTIPEQQRALDAWRAQFGLRWAF